MENFLRSALCFFTQLYVYGLVLGQIGLWLKDRHPVYNLLGISIAEMDPQLLLILFLPVLLFETAFFIDLPTFQRVAVHCALLAGPGCVITTGKILPYIGIACSIVALYP